MSAAAKSYLVAYNAFCCVGWAVVWAIVSSHAIAVFKNEAEWSGLWEKVESPLKIVQTAAVMEIIHAVLGLVRSPVVTAAMQVSSRLLVLWGCFAICEVSRLHWCLALTALSWATVEVPRYLFYAWNLVGKVPSWLFFLRYHLFMVLYPSGITGECVSMIKMLPWLHKTGAYAITLPNTLNVSISLFSTIIAILIIYIPGSPIMYSHMLKQRNSAYRKRKEE